MRARATARLTRDGIKKVVIAHDKRFFSVDAFASRKWSGLTCLDVVEETPAVVLDENALIGNVEYMQHVADKHQVSLRPHVKTHKCTKIANLQREHGARGVTCSKPDEALVFLQAGFDTLVAYPIINKCTLQKFLERAEGRYDKLTLMVDSAQGVEVLFNVVNSLPRVEKLNVYMKVNVGLNRCGVQPDGALQLAKEIVARDKLSFQGIMSHAGQAYGASSKRDCERIAREESELMKTVRDTLRDAGISCNQVSVGCTLTELAREEFGHITEIRPGNYVFMDATPLTKGLITPEQVSLYVVASVISVNNQYAIIDAGSKVLSSDAGAHGSAGTGNYGTARTCSDSMYQIEKLSEEHGWIKLPRSHDLEIGDKVQIIPNHSCPVVNLTNSVLLLGKDRACETWEIDAFNKSHPRIKYAQ
eukprot:CAMPEP_0203773494 /NCGR_PEP_ID=MMETSP0099_2-20121227/4692_1 /ASSEMBLY_ACC=CAM_ASM_000209 /TAXON_ID=96639 /ORGANISM=" , Strain NY0313808BC1" /LENGTH=417 /DNA_ID=CAMNT_0050671337 /DNA_START=121 /DNA_END=1374 /DNA_ORIENTATION=-